MGFNNNEFLKPVPRDLAIVIFGSGDPLPLGDSFAIFGRSDFVTNESDVDFIVPSAKVQVRRITLSVGDNLSTGFSVALHKNSVDLPATLLTVPAMTTGNFSTGILIDQFYDAGDLFAIHFNKLGGGIIQNITYILVVRFL